MQSTFWTNTIWYVLLGIVTLVELVFTMIKAQKRKLTFAFFLSVLGITLHYELMILIFLKGYTYYPMIIKNATTPFDDVLSGNLFSQFAIATTVLLVTVMNLKYYWYIVFALAYGAIEELFISLGVYTQNWYCTWMTVLVLPFAFWISKKMYLAIIKGVKPITYYLYVYLGLFPLHIITIIWGLMLAGYLEYSRTLLSDPISSRHFMAMLNFFMLLIPMMLIYFSKMKWAWKVLIVLITYLIYYLGCKLNLILIRDQWFLAVSTVTILWMYLSILAMDKLYGGFQKRTDRLDRAK